MTLNSQLPEGSKLTCVEGHEIAVTKIPLNKSKGWSADWFDWKISERPQDGQAFSGCPTCGKPYARVHEASGRNQICVNKEWWPKI